MNELAGTAEKKFQESAESIAAQIVTDGISHHVDEYSYSHVVNFMVAAIEAVRANPEASDEELTLLVSHFDSYDNMINKLYTGEDIAPLAIRKIRAFLAEHN